MTVHGRRAEGQRMLRSRSAVAAVGTALKRERERKQPESNDDSSNSSGGSGGTRRRRRRKQRSANGHLKKVPSRAPTINSSSSSRKMPRLEPEISSGPGSASFEYIDENILPPTPPPSTLDSFEPAAVAAATRRRRKGSAAKKGTTQGAPKLSEAHRVPSKSRHQLTSNHRPAPHQKLRSNWIPCGDGEGEGEAVGSMQWVQLSNDASAPRVLRRCFSAIRHCKIREEVVRVRDCVKVRSAEGMDCIGKVVALHHCEESGALMVTLLWFYTRNQALAEAGGWRKGAGAAAALERSVAAVVGEKELLASWHIDTINSDCIESTVYVLTYNEYCRFKAETLLDLLPAGRRPTERSELWPRGENNYPRRPLLPHEDTPAELVYFCRGVYSLRTKRVCTSLSLLPPLQPSSKGRSLGLHK